MWGRFVNGPGKRRFGSRLRNVSLRIGLGLGLLVTVLFYAMLIQRSTWIEVMYTRHEPLLQRIFAHDCLTALLVGYWAYLLIFIRRVKSPVVPFAIFFAHSVIEPTLLMGDNAVFLRFRRFGAFWAGYPIALATLAIWLLCWAIGNRAALLARIREPLAGSQAHHRKPNGLATPLGGKRAS